LCSRARNTEKCDLTKWIFCLRSPSSSSFAFFYAPLGLGPFAFRVSRKLPIDWRSAQCAVPSCPRSGVLMPVHIPYPGPPRFDRTAVGPRPSRLRLRLRARPRIASLLSDSLARAPSRTSATSGLSPVSVFVFADAEKRKAARERCAPGLRAAKAFVYSRAGAHRGAHPTGGTTRGQREGQSRLGGRNAKARVPKAHRFKEFFLNLRRPDAA
jgi:hypothetical protein